MTWQNRRACRRPDRSVSSQELDGAAQETPGLHALDLVDDRGEHPLRRGGRGGDGHDAELGALPVTMPVPLTSTTEQFASVAVLQLFPSPQSQTAL